MSRYIMIKFPDDLSIEESVDNMRTLDRLGFDFQWMNGGAPIGRDLFEYLPERQPKKYYLISYIVGNICGIRRTENIVIDSSPIEWIINVAELADHYRLMSTFEITKEEFDRMIDWEIEQSKEE